MMWSALAGRGARLGISIFLAVSVGYSERIHEGLGGQVQAAAQGGRSFGWDARHERDHARRC
jgi:hypothetical protein